MNSDRYPRATYRLQLNANFNFDDVIGIIDYLNELGISHLYLSPCLQASAGSTHGYDVVNHNLINSELGKKVDFALLSQRLKSKGMGIILDIVPNHMAISGPENPWWWDVLENGQASQYSRYFDVDWHADSSDRSNLILIPVLGNHYGIVLENGELQLKHQNGRFTLHYYENIFPVAPRSLPLVLEIAYKNCNINELGYLAGAFEHLPHASAREVDKISRRQRDKAVLEQLLQSLCSNANVRKSIDLAVEQINNDCDLLDSLIGRQNYKLAFWKLSKYQIGYRRFFNINSLVGLRMEDEQVFADSHRLLIEMVNEGQIDGFRVDHPDGLYDPTGYFARLRRACPETFIFAEKILEKKEKLRPEWQISGTTGYDFLNLANGLFIDHDGHEKLKKHWQSFTGLDLDYDELVYHKKKKVINDLLGSETNRLVSDLSLICENHRRYRDFGGAQLYQALAEVATGLNIYRTYLQPETGSIPEETEKEIKAAVDQAKSRKPELGDYIFDFIYEILTLKLNGDQEIEFVRRFQQFTGPVMAKSLEDTVFYIYHPLTSANEVGGNPKEPSVSTHEFHQWCEYISHNWPLTMLAGSTHDTKRSEDIRARLNLLSEIPDAWLAAVKEWQQINSKSKNRGVPDANTEYLLYQTMFGSWPISLERLSAYMQKAVREAKEETCWYDPNHEFENSLSQFIKNIYLDKNFINSFEKFLQPLVVSGQINSLAQLTLRLTAPGVPDIYQGNEIWDGSLTDPDNRRPVDFKQILADFTAINEMNSGEILYRMRENQSQPKLFIIKKMLKLRGEISVFHEPDSYFPLEVSGPQSERVVAFMRGERVLVVVPRLTHSLENNWGSTRLTLPEGTWRNIFTDARLKSGSTKVKDLLKDFPVAVLCLEGE